MVDMTLGLTMNNNDDNCDITTGSISYAIGNGLNVSLSAYENNDGDASATWTMGAMYMTYATDEASGCSAYRYYSLGGSAGAAASTAAANSCQRFGQNSHSNHPIKTTYLERGL